ncbi:MAG: hypothetical protein HYT49_00740 [Candidatus Wildermuthbacteria bacterium]|nr:hypothetical protein [Candidatus Wildermuthbacteria bacterium]
MKQRFYLGVEGGATKSTAILVDETSHVLGERKGKALNYQYLRERRVKQNLAELLNPLLRKVRGGNISAVFGFAGLDTPKDQTVYTKIAHSVLPKGSSLQAVNDTKIALEVRCPKEKNRILVISGTGSSVYGENGKTSAKSVGWGFLLGDEGSGYEFGLKTLKAAMRSFDKRGEKTILEKLIVQKFGGKTMLDVVPAIYEKVGNEKRNTKRYVASFAPLLDEAILQKDTMALAIREQEVEELFQGVSAVAKQLGIASAEFCLGTTGSLWKMPGFQEQFRKKIKKHFPKVCFSTNTDSSVWGAVLLAKKLI